MQNVFGTRGAGRRGQWIDRRTLPEPPPSATRVPLELQGPSAQIGCPLHLDLPLDAGRFGRGAQCRGGFVEHCTIVRREFKPGQKVERPGLRQVPTVVQLARHHRERAHARRHVVRRFFQDVLPLSLSQRPSCGRLADRNQRGAARPGAGQRRRQRKSLLLLKQGDVTLVAGDAAQRPRPGSTTRTGDDIGPQCGCQSRSKHARR